MILNSAAPTAERDVRLANVMTTAAETLESDVDVRIETVTIDDLDEVSSAVSSLVNRGVTVIATSCDDSSMPFVVDSAIAEQLLAVTGCVTLPRPDLSVRSRLFIDLAGLNDTPLAIAQWVKESEYTSVAVLSSELIPDVSNTCTAVEGALAGVDVGLGATATFTELIDDTETLIASLTDRLVEAEAIVVCALAPSLGDVVFSLRAAGFEQPVIVPWFGDLQFWPEDTNDVFVLAAASRYGDDPQPDVQELFSTLTTPEAVDIVAADTVAILAASADSAGSTGSRRLADTMRSDTTSAVSGLLTIDPSASVTAERNYRLLEIVNGEPVFRVLVSEAGIIEPDS